MWVKWQELFYLIWRHSYDSVDKTVSDIVGNYSVTARTAGCPAALVNVLWNVPHNHYDIYLIYQ